MNNKIRKMQTAAGGGLVYNDGKNIERTNYDNWSKLSLVDKMKRRFNIAKHQFNESSSPIINSVGAIFGEYDPENPDLNTVEPSILPSRGINPKTVQNVAKGVRTLEDYLKATKVSAPKLEGTSQLRNSYADDRFIGGTIFRNSLPDEAMQVQGHGMAKSATIQDALARLRYILDNGIDKTKNFYTLPLKLPKGVTNLGDAGGTGGGVPYFDGHFLITGKPGQRINSVGDIGTVYINDAYQNEEALKAAQKLQQYLQQSYPKINFKLYSQGFKQGGKMNILEFLKNGSGIYIKKKNRGKFTKAAKAAGQTVQEHARSVLNDPNATPLQKKRANFARNAAKWKHKSGGIIKAEDGVSTSLLGLLPGVGTYQDYKEFEKNPNWRTGISLGVSALGDAAMLTGAGAIIKGVSAANKARKILGTAGKAANVARQQAWKQASKLKRESDAVNSLTLMNAPTNKILERQASKNLAKKSYEEALKNDETALKIYQTAANNPALNFKSSQFTPLIYTNPGFHAASQAIKHKSGGIIKAGDGNKLNGWQKIGNFLNSDTGKFIANTGMQLYKGINDSIKQADWMKQQREYIQKQKEAIINNVGNVSEMAKQQLALKKQLNPDQNFSQIDLANTIHQLETQKRLDNMDKVNRWEANQLANLNITYNAIKGESGYNEVLENQLGNIFKQATTV